MFSRSLLIPDTWGWISIGWLILLPYTIARFWGLLLVPALVIIFWGLIWREWNRAIGGSLIAILLAAVTVICEMQDPFFNLDLVRVLVGMGIPALILVFAVSWELLKKRVIGQMTAATHQDESLLRDRPGASHPPP